MFRGELSDRARELNRGIRVGLCGFVWVGEGGEEK